MAIRKVCTTVTVLLIFMTAFPECFYCTNISHVTTTCGDQVAIKTPDQGYLIVNLTFNQSQPDGAACSWLIAAGNSTMSNQVVLTGIANASTLSCDKNVFSVSEKNPADGTLNPITLECMDKLFNPDLTIYNPVVGYPGFSILVSLNTTSALTENFLFMRIMAFVWTDEVCPRTERRIVIAQPGSEYSSERLSPAGLLSRFPDNMVCKWEFRSPDEGVVNLELKTSWYDSDSSHECRGGDHFVVMDGNVNSTAGPTIIPLCKDPGVHFTHSSTTGSILVNLVSDSSGGAYQSFYFKYWSVQSCPSILMPMLARVGEKYRFKGSSFSLQGAGQEQRCQWRIYTGRIRVIKLYQLEAAQFQQDCDESKDYLLVNGHKVSICNGNAFPVWSENTTMYIAFHSNTEQVRRSFLLHFTAVYKSACQGFPVRKTVVGSKYVADRVVMKSIPLGDIENGLVCQWIFTAKDKGNGIIVSVDWAEDSSRGVPFDKDSCSFPNFHVYNGDSADNSSEITPTCSADNSTISYTSTARDLRFVYQRQSGVAESGFVMKLNQVREVSNDGGAVKSASLLCWGAALVGLFVFVLFDLTG
ncbi:uncharacterized protein LOC143283294 [Babylonia areolata]|uniref:uncharacterized protein LOC143283294 n=1 Tax=Babylonia areolata TaxID=304850 RepID=UPI003FD3D67A